MTSLQFQLHLKYKDFKNITDHDYWYTSGAKNDGKYVFTLKYVLRKTGIHHEDCIIQVYLQITGSSKIHEIKYDYRNNSDLHSGHKMFRIKNENQNHYLLDQWFLDDDIDFDFTFRITW